MIKQDQSQVITDFIASLPKNLIHDTGLMAAYSRYLLSKHDDSQAEALLRRCLRKQFDEQLIDIYGLVKGKEAQLSFAESMLKEQPHSAALFLCLGRLSKTKNLWGKARLYFEQSIEFGATPVAYLELGKLLEQLSDHPGASTAYQQGLLLATQQD